jgi:PilZ domain
MATNNQNRDGPRLEPGNLIYLKLLDKARHVSDRVLTRLQNLHDHFPAALTSEHIAQLERIHTDPVNERRRVLRFPGPSTTTSVAEARNFTEWTTATVINHSSGGLALQLNHPVHPGAILLVWVGLSSSEDAWFPFEVRHCRQEGEDWVVGGEFVAAELSS